MAKETDGGNAFPACNEANVNGTMGMSVRQYYKAAAIQGMLAADINCEWKPEALAMIAGRFADEALREDEKHYSD